MDIFSLVDRLLRMPLKKEPLEAELGVTLQRESSIKRWRGECDGLLAYVELIDIPEGDNRVILGMGAEIRLTLPEVAARYEWHKFQISQIIPQAGIISYVHHFEQQDLIFSFVRDGETVQILRMAVIVRRPLLAEPINLGKAPM